MLDHEHVEVQQGVAVARWEHEATPSAVGAIRRELHGFARLHGIDADGCRDLAVAVSEAVTNVVRHAYPEGTTGPVLVAAASDDASLTVRVTDRGAGGTATAGTSLGLGIPTMAALSDRMEIGPGRNGHGTVVTLEFSA